MRAEGLLKPKIEVLKSEFQDMQGDPIFCTTAIEIREKKLEIERKGS